MRTSRPRQLADAALRLNNEPGTDATSHAVAAMASTMLGCADAGVVVAHPDGRVESVATTGTLSPRVHQLQIMVNEGPGIEAVRTASAVVMDDVTIDTRWPECAAQAKAMEWRAYLAVPLRTSHATLGVLDFAAAEPGTFGKDDLDVAAMLAAHSSVALASARIDDGLRAAVEARHLIGQAEGILMERHGIGAGQAFETMRRRSVDKHVKLRQVAEDVIRSRETRES